MKNQCNAGVPRLLLSRNICFQYTYGTFDGTVAQKWTMFILLNFVVNFVDSSFVDRVCWECCCHVIPLFVPLYQIDDITLRRATGQQDKSHQRRGAAVRFYHLQNY